MSDSLLRYPQLDRYYQRFLTEENSAEFIQSVSQRYSMGTLERLAQYGQRRTRRAAILAIGFLGTFDNNETLGRALSDDDRAVRMLAEHGARQIWQRQGTPGQQVQLQALYRFNDQGRSEEAVSLATEMIGYDRNLGEAWSQRGIALCALGEFADAVVDCRETLQCNRFHFPAAMGLAHCCLQLDEMSGALAGFRLALNINPDLDGVRAQISKLERLLEN